jgi:hypothetical protein
VWIASQKEPWRSLYGMTSVVCACSTTRQLGSRVRQVHSTDNLRTTLCAMRCMRSEK